MPKYHASQHLGYNSKGHRNFDFLDINLREDNEIFIDPCLLEVSDNPYGTEAALVVQSFFDKFYQALRDNDRETYHALLLHARERNAAKLGYGNGLNGTGNSPEGLAEKLMPLWELADRIGLTRPMDIAIFISGFGLDGMTDLITNVACKPLLGFTQAECAKQDQRHLTPMRHWFWNRNSNSWEEEVANYPTYNNNPFLLIPKDCARNRFIMSTSHYLRRGILERQKRESARTDERGRETTTSKKDLMNRIPKDEQNWRYSYTTDYTENHPDVLDEYYEATRRYFRERRLSNERLDELIY